MNLFKKDKQRQYILCNVILITIAFFITIILIATGSYIQVGYNLKPGMISPYRFKAPRRIENTMATERRKAAAERAANDLKPLLKKDTDVNDKVINNITAFFNLVDELRLEATRKLQVSTNVATATTAVSDTFDGWDLNTPPPAPTLPIPLTEIQTKLLLEMDTTSYNKLRADVYQVVNKALDQGIQEVDAKTLLYIRDENQKLGSAGDIQMLAYEIESSYIQPNFVVDVTATEKARSDIANNYDPVYILQDQKIVDESELITEEIFSILNSLGYVSNGYFENIVPVIGALIVVSIVFAVTLFYIAFNNRTIATSRRDALLFFTIYVIIIISCRAFSVLPYQFLPIFVMTMLVSMLIDSKLSLVTNAGVTIIAALIIRGDLSFVFQFIVGGIAVSIISSFATERSRIFIIGILISAVNFTVTMGVDVFFQKNISTAIFYSALYAAASGMLTVIIAVGTLPFWEAVFGVVTVLKLLDLTNPNNAILRRLTIEAPGTYHHSIIVGNLAENAAGNIGANTNLTRAGAYFHDIGKLKYPQYYAENQVGENPHDLMDSYSSVQVILRHVSYGAELADNYKLPNVIKDMITQHHGNSLIKYFYVKAKQENENVDDKDFRYNSVPPQTKEAALIMLADTVEAAVRSAIPRAKSFEEIETLIKKLIKDKLDDGQLIDSGFTIKDMDVIEKSFSRMFKAMYHERIVYPEDKKEAAENVPEQKS